MVSNLKKRESTILKDIMLKLSRGTSRLFRNNVGVLQDRDGRYVRYGVGGNGGSDLLGWDTIIVTHEHIGARLAVFCAVEVKKDGETPTPEQLDFLAMVSAAGGRAGVARSPEEALDILKGVDKNKHSH